MNLGALVALRKESVDRNAIRWNTCEVPTMSLSARRAWIEICLPLLADKLPASLSARRAWIEIWASGPHGTVSGVALRKESVDRN